MRRQLPRGSNGKVDALFVVTILAVLAVLLAAGAFYYAAIKAPTEARVKQQNELIVRMIDLNNQPVSNRLDPQFKDVDGNLVADPPADPSQQLDPPVLYFSYIATDNPETYRDAFKEFTDALAKATDKKVEYVLLDSAQAELRALRDGKLQIAGLETGAVPVAVNVAGFIPCATVASVDGVATYQTQIIVPADSPLHTPADLRGHDLTCTDPSSNSGFKAPLVLLRSEFNLLPARDFQIRCSNGHRQSIDLVAAHQCDAAAVASSLLTRAIASGSIKDSDYRVIYKSENFPNAAIGCTSKLKPALAEKIRQAILAFDWKGTGLEKELGPSGGAKFVPVNYKNDFALVRRIDDASGTVHKID